VSENELFMGESSSKGSKDVCSNDGNDYYVFNGDFAPHTLASPWLPVKTAIEDSHLGSRGDPGHCPSPHQSACQVLLRLLRRS